MQLTGKFVVKSSRIQVYVTKCGTPVTLNNKIYVQLRNGIGQRDIQRYPAFKTSAPGVYVSSIPLRRQRIDPEQELTGEMCHSVANKIDTLCRLFPPIVGFVELTPIYCGQLIAALNAIPGALTGGVSLATTLPATPTVFATCMSTVAIGETLCGSLGYSPDPNWSSINYQNDNLMELMCNKFDKIKDPVLGLDTVSIQAYTGSGYINEDLISENKEVSAYGPFPSLTINSDKTTIEEFTTSPSDPKSGQGYTVTSTQSCTHTAEILASRDNVEIVFNWDHFPTDTLQGSVSVDTPGEPLGLFDYIQTWAINTETDVTVTKDRLIKYPAPKVRVDATDSSASENGSNATFTLTRSGASTKEALTIWYNWSGSADMLDYDAFLADGSTATRYATIPSNASSTTVTIRAKDDDRIEGIEIVILKLSASREGKYTLNSSSSATISIIDNDEEGGVCASQGLEGPEILTRNGLNWQRCDDGYMYTWEQANTYCQELVLGGYSDWHLPTKDELKSLVACSNGHPVPLDDLMNCGSDGYGSYDSPTIDSQFSCRSYHYWSSSTYEYDSDNAWRVNFEFGPADYLQQWRELWVRCVR